LPPLRKRREDILLLTEYFLEKSAANTTFGKGTTKINENKNFQTVFNEYFFQIKAPTGKIPFAE